MVGMVLFLSSCGGGSTTPASHDLAGLEGTWDYTIVCNGVISGSGGSVTYNETFIGYWIIGRNSVIDQDGDPWVWAYDGSTLTLDWGGNETFQDPDCGEIYATGSDHATIPIVSGATTANITGNSNVNFYTEFCGDISGNLPITGNMTKR